jgi:hypothetical protein
MTNTCRVTPGSPFTIASSNTPLKCILFNAPTGVQITAASCVDHATGDVTAINLAADGQSFEVPVDTPGEYGVNAVVNQTSGVVVHIAEDCPGHTELLFITDKTDNFVLQVN